MLETGTQHITLPQVQAASKAELYTQLLEQAQHLFADEHDFLANTATFAALIYNSLPDLNWAGFYLLQGETLVLGPFQGKIACVRIAMGKGVCGTSAARRETIRVEDVDAFPGHIVCDSASRSEIVLPLVKNGDLFGVFDIDSPILSRFDAEDEAGLAALVACYVENTDIPATGV